MSFKAILGCIRGFSDDAGCNVYVMHDAAGGCCKVGIAVDCGERRRTLATGNPRIELVGSIECVAADWARAVEKLAHVFLETSKIDGEWFSVTPELAWLAVNKASEAINGLHDCYTDVSSAHILEKFHHASPDVQREFARYIGAVR